MDQESRTLGPRRVIVSVGRSGISLTVIEAWATLLLPTRSTTLEDALAELVKTPYAVALARMVIVPVAPDARVPTLQVTVLLLTWQAPNVDWAEIKESAGDTVSTNTTLLADEGPRFVNTIVKVVLLETVTEPGLALCVKLKSALAITAELEEAELLPGTGSTPARFVTLAVLNIVGLLTGARSVKVAVATALLATVPKLNPIPPLDKLVVPELRVPETKVAPAGNGLVSTRLVAGEGPRLVTLKV